MKIRTSIPFAVRALVVCLAALLVVTPLFADDASADALNAVSPKYTIWQGTCSRSLKAVQTHDTLNAVLNAAHQLQKDEAVIILEGASDWHSALRVLQSRRGVQVLDATIHRQVYQRGCRTRNWRTVTLPDEIDMESTEAYVTDLQKQGSNAKIVYQVKLAKS